MLRKKIILFFWISFFSMIASASWLESDGTRLIALLNQFHSMQADFTQTTFNSRKKQMQQSHGHMALLRPGKFRWDTQSPSKQLLVADGTYVWVYDKSLEQAIRNKLSDAGGTNPASLLSGSVASLQKRFTVTGLNNPGGEWFELKPTIKNDIFQSIQLEFINNQLQQMIVADNLGQQSTFTFSNVKTNAPLDPSLFHFVPPAKTDVIKN